MSMIYHVIHVGLRYGHGMARKSPGNAGVSITSAWS